jgi:hypothetical protein
MATMPPGYLRHFRALFPDKQRVLHLFSGKVQTTETAIAGAVLRNIFGRS